MVWLKSRVGVNFQSGRFLFCWVILVGVVGILCDLPPNCIHGDVVGVWRIHVGTYRPCVSDPKYEDSACGFPSPDRDDAHSRLTPAEGGLLTRDFKLSFTFDVKFEDSELRVTSVQNLDGPDSGSFNDFETAGTVGNWTVILDQAFTFWTKSHRFTAFFKYINEPEDINAAYCYCHTTLLGWWDSYPELAAEGEYNQEQNRILSVEERGEHGNYPWLIMSDDLRLRRGCWYGMRIFDGDGKMTDRTEWTLKLPRWRASPLGLPPDHPANAQNPTIAEYLSELSESYSGIRGSDDLWRRSDKFEIHGSDHLTTLPQIRRALHISPHYAQRRKSNEQYVTEISEVREKDQALGSRRPDADEPVWLRIKSFDWSNPDHVYGRLGRRAPMVPDVFHQGDCGNCFAVTAATIMTSRLWIKYSGHPELFREVYASPLQMTECNVYNQGCGGGLITLAFKFAQEVGVRTHECIEDYARHIGVKKIHPAPVYTPDEEGIADDGHSFLQTKGGSASQSDLRLAGDDPPQEHDLVQESGSESDLEHSEYQDEEMDDEHIDEGGLEHLSSSHEYYGDLDSPDSKYFEELRLKKNSKFNVIQQLCWDLGGHMGAANTHCRSDIPITKNIPRSCSRIIRVKEYGYVNNVYGKTTVQDIMESLWNEGPVAVSLEPTLEFSLYNSGVFKGFYDPVSRQYPWSSIPWFKVDHAMVITGWGWETYGSERVPYWIVQNSWGSRWGERGFCRIIRGVNELSIEHAAVRASVVIYDSEKSFKPTDMSKVHDDSVFQYL
ncbi:hypothetical protein OIY81_2587 [Cryptosporidium canis]|nr:hypothetical protein OIY81_2587 [Cryptosporidium canis]